MKVIPMIFNTDMVKGLVAGDMVVTRRPLIIHEGWELKDRKLTKITSSHPKKGKWGALIRQETFDDKYQHDIITAPCFVDDLIYVRETFRLFNHSDECGCSDYCSCPPSGTPVYFATCGDDSESKWKSSRHMPRSASRLTLKVTDVRIERVQDITEDQAEKEGVISNEKYGDLAGEENLFNCPKCEGFQVHGYIGYGGGVAEGDCETCNTAVKRFGLLWDSIYQNWNQNPYVWVIEFEVIHQNVDKYLESVKEAA
ncbi:hypothetical protein [Vibrio cholerae]|uniref:hypothetical protein n=1 Tax=Vibrio cholerae TaxID=666 RepID=UPI002DB84AD5|nr:hypothetical protein [Vibrio cholerae]MEB5538634.1 hypothetical protein [Vibrio cholerae]MEB5547269.1 hypothetical protein [Vibrio cholerae]